MPFYDRAVVQWTEDNKQPTAVMEEITLPMTNFSSPAFTGPVMVSYFFFSLSDGGQIPSHSNGFPDHEVRFTLSKRVRLPPTDSHITQRRV